MQDRQVVARSILIADLLGDGDAQGEGAHVGQDELLYGGVVLDQGRLDRGPHGHDLVGVEFRAWLLAQGLAHEVDDQGHPRRAADQDHLVEVAGLAVSVPEGPRQRPLQASQEAGRGLGEGLALDLDGRRIVAEATVGFGDSERRHRVHGESSLDLFGLGQEPRGPQGLAQLDELEVQALLAQGPGGQAGREVLAAELPLPGSRGDLEGALEHAHQGHVEGPPAQVEHQEALLGVGLLVAIGQGRGRRLVQDPAHGQASQLPRDLGRLALVVVEVGRDRDHRLADLAAEVLLGVGLERAQDEARELGRREGPAPELDGGVAPHDPFEGPRHELGLGHAQLEGRAPHDHLTVFEDPDDGGRQEVAEGVGDQLGLACPEHGAERMGRAEVDAENGSGGHGGTLWPRTRGVKKGSDGSAR